MEGDDLDKAKRLFSFQNNFYECKLKFGFINLLQVAEAAMIPQSGVFEHIQVCHEITYIVSGRGVFRTGDNEYEVKQGDIHCIAKGDVHEISVPASENLRYICIGFDFDDIPEEYREVCEFYMTSPQSVAKGSSDIRTLFEMLINEFYVTRTFNEVATEAIIRLILVKVCRCFEDNNTELAPTRMYRQSVIYKIVKYVDENIEKVRSVGEISKKLHYTESYVSTVFRKNMGITLQGYIREKKLESAKMLLEYGNRTVAEVSELMSFDSVENFSKSFKKKYGLTPYRYILSKRKDDV